jgi:hypothetical protein
MSRASSPAPAASPSLRALATALILGSLVASPVQAQSAADSAAIRASALDYAHGWYTADGARMQRALHPELAKRIVEKTGSGFVLDHMDAAQLTRATRSGGGSNTPANARQADVAILDIFRNAASVRLTMNGWIDYMHMARWEDRWVIVNVLWELKED